MPRYIPHPIAKPLILDGYLCNIPEIEELHKRNGFLAELISAVQKPSPARGYMLNSYEAAALCEVFTQTGYVDSIHSYSDFKDDVNMFWELIEYGQKKGKKPGEKHNRIIYGVCHLYSKMRNTGVFTENFKEDPKSPYYFMYTDKFQKRLDEENININNFYAVRYLNVDKPKVFSYKTKSQYLFDRIYITLCKHRVHKNRSNISWRISLSLENYFADSDAIKGHQDFTPQCFTSAIQNILADDKNNKETKHLYLKLLFNVWYDLIEDHSNYDFFEGSSLYTTDVILNGYVPTRLAEGYTPVICNSLVTLPTMNKVLFLVSQTHLRSSYGNGHLEVTLDVSDLPEMMKKVIVNYANYCLANGNKSYIQVKMLLQKYVIPIKEKWGDSKYFHITIKDLYDFRAAMHFADLDSRTESTYLNTFKTFLRWARKNDYMTVEEGALQMVTSIRRRNKYNPKALSKEEIAKIDAALKELGKEDKRFGVIRCIFNIQLNSEARAGEICSMHVSAIKMSDDGKTCQYSTRIKNNGKALGFRNLASRATYFLKKAKQLSLDERYACPDSELKDCVFLYKLDCDNAKTYNVINIDRYNRDLKTACKKAGVRPISSGNVRDTYMTAAMIVARKKKLTPQERTSLTGHTNTMSSNSYYDIDFRRVVEACQEVYLGKLQ